VPPAASTAPPASSASTPAPSSTTTLAAGKVFDADYDGTIGPSQIYAQLSQDGLKGRYFYGKRAGFLELAGSTSGQGSLVLREIDSGKHSGTFTLEKQGDALTGDWESADRKRKLPVSLRRISRRPGDPVLLVKRELRGARPAKEPAGFDWVDASTCITDIDYYQVLGLADRKLQAELDARFAPPDLPDCTVPGDVSGSPQVHMNERGVLSADFTWGYTEAGRARPGEGGATSINALVDQGIAELPVDRILDPKKLPSIRTLLEKTIDAGQHVTPKDPLPESIRDQLVEGVLDHPEVRLTANGLVFCPEAGFPQAFDALEGCQYSIPYSELGAVLVPTSPASFLWKKPKEP
jgi:hypothetical protein